MSEMIRIDPETSLWGRVFNVAPLVVIGTREGDGYDLAPKHMAMPLGWNEYFGFVCTPAHATLRNAQEVGTFSVSYPGPDQVVIASLTAAPRCDEESPTPGLDALPTHPTEEIDGVVLRDARLVLECELDRIVDDLGRNRLVIGRIVAARAHRDALRATEVDDENVVRRAPLLAYLDPGRYAEISESRSFPFPKGFER